jgi:hypothetical protein
MQNRLIKTSAFIVIMIILVSLIILSSTHPNDLKSEKYYGPPLSDAIYQEIDSLSLSEKNSSMRFNVTSDWLGVRITVISDLPTFISLIALNPDGKGTIELEQQFFEGHSEIGEIRSFDPQEIDYSIAGEWTINYQIDNGPVTVIIDRVVSFGNPNT